MLTILPPFKLIKDVIREWPEALGTPAEDNHSHQLIAHYVDGTPIILELLEEKGFFNLVEHEYFILKRNSHEGTANPFFSIYKKKSDEAIICNSLLQHSLKNKNKSLMKRNNV